MSGLGAEEYLGGWGQGMPQKSHHATDVTQEIYCEAGKRPPLRGTRERQTDSGRDRDAQAESRLLGQELFKRCMCCIWWLIMSPWRQTGRSPGS